MTNVRRCAHARAVPVESGGETVAALCPDCDRQLPAAWLTCPHEDTIEMPEMGAAPPHEQLCNGCGAIFWPEPQPARWVFVESLADPTAPTEAEIAAGVELTGVALPEPWLSEAAWAAQPQPDALHLRIVHDPDIGTLAELTTPDGRRFYGFDAG
ncbi:hypothetical protein [Actinomadura sp. DC4]|uniref:hypothetical protein n=1 Tax=Actinomadura sp. DC4 TaxID=3055069 RepID=UPI0025AFBEB7|nr:hypothetical protein [Actinomadura sp. DC4]MDN3356065.1 hypothetical protein [Actinomadura sp. DC4]